MENTIKLSKRYFETHFSVGDKIFSGGMRSKFVIIGILDDKIRIELKSKYKCPLFYNRLSAIVNNFKKINPKRIESTVGEVLKLYKLNDTQNETYLYGMAREILSRNNYQSSQAFEKELEHTINKSRISNSNQRLTRLKNAPKIPEEVYTLSKKYMRNPDVVVEVLIRANGVCEKCGSTAPFLRKKDGTPYLEVHHKIQLVNGGEDIVENAIALCPNCHRQAHFG